MWDEGDCVRGHSQTTPISENILACCTPDAPCASSRQKKAHWCWVLLLLLLLCQSARALGSSPRQSIQGFYLINLGGVLTWVGCVFVRVRVCKSWILCSRGKGLGSGHADKQLEEISVKTKKWRGAGFLGAQVLEWGTCAFKGYKI